MGTDQGGVRPGPLAISTDVAIVGAGAAGLATAIFTRRLTTALDVVLLDGAKHTGAKILVSGGTRCNITNRSVRETDYWTDGSRAAIRRILRALPVDATIAWFEELGVHMHEEAGGKLFPDSNRARDVLQALLREVSRTGASVYEGTRVLDVAARDGAFTVHTARGTVRATSVVLATGGRSLPKTGSDGTGYALAQRLGHTLVSTCPALAPLVLRAGASPHASLSGIAHDVELAVWIDGRIAERFAGAMLWTHFGVSGPVALDASRHWERAVLDGRDVRITMNACAGRSHEALDRDLVTRAATRPKASLASAIGDFVPAAVAQALIREARLEPALTLAGLTRDARRQLAHTLTAWELPVVGSRGFTHAEATAGGVKLDEIDPKTMESRICPGLYLVGEVLDVDGRLGGFNFQWAWASARVAAGGLAARAA